MNALSICIVAISLALYVIGVLFYMRGIFIVTRTLERMEFGAKRVADNLESSQKNVRAINRQRERMEETLYRMETASHVVAENLADSVSRADATIGPEGAAADAALRTGDTAAAITERQEHLTE